MASEQPKKRARPDSDDVTAAAAATVPASTEKNQFSTWLQLAKKEIGYYKALADFSADVGDNRLFLGHLAFGFILQGEQLRLRPLCPDGFTYEWDRRSQKVIPGTTKFLGSKVSSKVEWFLSVYQYAVKHCAKFTIKLGDDAIFIIYNHRVLEEGGVESMATFGNRLTLPKRGNPIVDLIATTLLREGSTNQNSIISRLAECTMKVLPLLNDKSIDCVQLITTVINDKTFIYAGTTREASRCAHAKL
jgi:hypothetical protein